MRPTAAIGGMSGRLAQVADSVVRDCACSLWIVGFHHRDRRGECEMSADEPVRCRSRAVTHPRNPRPQRHVRMVAEGGLMQACLCTAIQVTGER